MVVDLLMLTGLQLRAGARAGARRADHRSGRRSRLTHWAPMSGTRPHLPPVWAMALSLVAVAANLRTAMASVPPLAESIMGGLGLSGAALGALTTLPVLCMGVFAPLAQRVAARIGAAGAVEAAAACAAVGLATRFAGGHVGVLYAGTFVAGVGIAIGGTLLPGLVKELFPPQRSGLVTGLYMLAMMGGAAASSALVGADPAVAGLVAGVARLVVPARPGRCSRVAAGGARARPTAGGEPAVVDPGTLPWRHLTAWLVAGYLPCSPSSSTPRWPGSHPATSPAAGTRHTPATCCRRSRPPSWFPACSRRP